MKIKRNRLLSLLLALITVAFAAASCFGGETDDQTNDADVSTSDVISEDDGPQINEDGVALFQAPLLLSDLSKCYYQVVRADDYTDTIMSCMRMISDYPKTIDEKTKLKLTPTTDWVKAGTDTSGFCEILIGYTNRAESFEVMNEIGYDDFAIVTKGNKIVIAAHTEERLLEASKFFCEKLLSFETDDNGVQKINLIGTYHYRSEKEFVITEENALSSYKIICNTASDTVKDSAKQLQKAIKDSFGVEMQIADESEAETECELVLGNVNRDICRKYIDQNADLSDLALVIATQGKKILIGMKNDVMLPMGISTFCSTYASKYYSNTLNFEKDACKMSLPYKFNDSTELAEGADIRIMSFNVLCELWNDKLPISGRDATMMAVLTAYAPEVVGLQEISDKYYDSIEKLFGDRYAIVDEKNGKGETNFSPLAYNTEKVTLKDHGVQVFSKGNSTKLRLASWAVFESKISRKTFAVVNTHWDLGNNVEYRNVHAKEMAGIVNELKAKYNCPVITTGDYNTRDSESQYSRYVSLASLSSAKHTAKKVDHAYASTHTVGKMVSTSTTESIDHIFGTSDVEFLYYNMLIDQIVLDSSDHCPIYADIKLN